MSEAQLRHAYEERICWMERRVRRYLGVGDQHHLIEPYSGYYNLNHTERLKATVAGHRPSMLTCFFDMLSYQKFVFGVERDLREKNAANGVLLEALEYHKIDTMNVHTKEHAEQLFQGVLSSFDMKVLIFLQGKYELSTKFIFEELGEPEKIRAVFVMLHDSEYNK